MICMQNRRSRVVAALHDAVKQLAARAQLHHQVHAALVLIRALEPRDVDVACQVVHDLDLSLHILDVLWGSAQHKCQLFSLCAGLIKDPESHAFFGFQYAGPIKDPESHGFFWVLVLKVDHKGLGFRVVVLSVGV